MECRKFEVTLISAIGLQDVRRLFKMKVYAKVFLGGNQTTEKRTPIDRHGKTNPAWNFSIKYAIGESVIQHYGTMLVIKLYCKHKLGDRYIGEIHKPMRELYDFAYPNGGSAMVTYPVQRGSVNSQGHLTFSYRFGEKVSVDELMLAGGITAFITEVN